MCDAEQVDVREVFDVDHILNLRPEDVRNTSEVMVIFAEAVPHLADVDVKIGFLVHDVLGCSAYSINLDAEFVDAVLDDFLCLGESC